MRSQDLASPMEAFINKAFHCLLYATVIINYLKTIYYEPVIQSSDKNWNLVTKWMIKVMEKIAKQIFYS